MASALSSSRPGRKIELHLHLDGAVRPETVWQLLKEKDESQLPGDGSLEALRNALVATKPSTLDEFLSHFVYISKAISGDLVAVERIAYELCEDKAKDGVIYMEPRYSPHLMLDKANKPDITLRDVVASANRGFRRGERDFNIKCRSILVIVRGNPAWSSEIVELCEEFRDDGVVGIDLACLEHGEETVSEEDVRAFRTAKEKGIHRTAHAGESGPASSVRTAVNKLHAERIGHGYHVVDDDGIYSDVKKQGIHFETCPYSSILTGAVPLDTVKHPILRFCEDGVSFSVSTDDPTITGKLLSEDYGKLISWGLTEEQLAQANINAAKVAFLPTSEKEQLLKQLEEN